MHVGEQHEIETLTSRRQDSLTEGTDGTEVCERLPGPPFRPGEEPRSTVCRQGMSSHYANRLRQQSR